MTSKERMILQFQHKETDRVPVGDPCINSRAASQILGRPAYTGMGGWVLKEAARMRSIGKRDEFARRFSEDTLELHEKCGLDFICCELVPGKQDRTEVCFENENTWTVTDKKTGMWWKYAYNEACDDTCEIDSLIKREGEEAIPVFVESVRQAGEYIDLSELENIRYCCQQAGDRIFMFARPPYVYPAGTSWFTLFLELMITEPETAHWICDTMLERTLKYIDAIADAGAHGLFVHGDWAANNGTIFSPGQIREYFKPQMLRMTARAHERGLYFVKHTDGNIMGIADDFCLHMGFDGYQSIEPNAGMSMKVMKENYGDKILLMGNVDCGRILPYGTEQEIRDAVIRCIGEGAPGGGFCLTSCNSISGDITAERFMLMVDTAKQYGTYPIGESR